jgi:hypothetical protein
MNTLEEMDRILNTFYSSANGKQILKPLSYLVWTVHRIPTLLRDLCPSYAKPTDNLFFIIFCTTCHVNLFDYLKVLREYGWNQT